MIAKKGGYMDKVIIIGGGIIGGSILYHLYKNGYRGKAVIIEEMDALAQGSTSLSAGGFRNIWSTEVNMKLTTYSIKRFSESEKEFGVSIGFDQRGYLFTFYEDNFNMIKDFKPNWDRAGVRTELLTPEEIEKMVPGLHTSLEHLDPEIVEFLELKPIAGGLLGLDCGLVNPTPLAVAYIEKAKEMYPELVEIKLKSHVDRIIFEGGRTKGVITGSETIEGDIVILAAGAWSAKILEDSGVSDEQNIPVVPLKRMLYVVNPPEIEGVLDIPFTIIDKGVYFRPEAMNWLVGKAKEEQEPGFDTEPEKDYYEEFINYIMQARIDGAEYCRIQSMWGGLYAHNTKDKNGIVSFHPDFENLFLATGFSGHGVMEAPGIGQSVSEFLLKGKFETIPEVSQLDYKRFRENKLVKETIVI